MCEELQNTIYVLQPKLYKTFNKYIRRLFDSHTNCTVRHDFNGTVCILNNFI